LEPFFIKKNHFVPYGWPFPTTKEEPPVRTHTMNYLQLLGLGGVGGEIGVDEDFHPPSQMRCKLTPNVIVECS
jgi:hypothetical protein